MLEENGVMLDVKLGNLKRLEKKYVLEYEKEEIEKGLIMFYGDSSFTRWSANWGHRPLEEDIRMKDGSKAVVNHGLGTSTAEEQLYFYNRIVRRKSSSCKVVFLNMPDVICRELSFICVMFVQYRKRWMIKEPSIIMRCSIMNS